MPWKSPEERDLELLAAKMDAVLTVLQENNVLLATIFKVMGVPVKMHIQFQGMGLDQPGTETDIQSIVATCTETDSGGNPVPLDPRRVQWSVDNPNLVGLVQDFNGSATLRALGALGTVNVTVRDIGSGLAATEPLTITVSAAKNIKLVWGKAK